MTADEETRERLRALRRQLRDDKIHRGQLTPRTYRETAIWRAGVADRFGFDDQVAGDG